MRTPHERGPLSAAVISALTDPNALRLLPDLAAPDTPVTSSPDAQLALWVLYELHYRGFDDVPADLEWDARLISVRRAIERRFELELRQGTADRLAALTDDSDVVDSIFALTRQDDSPSVAQFLQREATTDQFKYFVRERSIQQLKESDPQSFVLPRLSDAAKAALAEVQYDEYGGGRPERMHSTLFAAGMRAVGLRDEYGAYIDQVSAMSLACCNVMSLFALNRQLRGAAMGHFAAFEATSSMPSRKILGGVQRLELPVEVATYFDEHVEADAVHEHLVAHDICGSLVAADPTMREDVLFGAAACLYLQGLSASDLLQRMSYELEGVR